MSSPFHRGELEAQRHEGVEPQAARVGRMIAPEVDGETALFLPAAPMIVVGHRDARGRLWADLATAARALDLTTVDVDAPFAPTGEVGLLAIDFSSRSRVRVNGVASTRPGGFRIAVKESYGNCPKYIHPRVPAGPATPSKADGDLIAKADTFFIASANPEGHADVSHRGGPPGFVKVERPGVLTWDDFPGNRMFNTTGNLIVDPRAGLLFVEFDGTRTLRLTGRARAIWEPRKRIEFEIDEAVEVPRGNPTRWT
jgi:predicted pyridoxine 5'-phosphate oxidase superfamily flavin-nucleotide-binding protein